MKVYNMDDTHIKNKIDEFTFIRAISAIIIIIYHFSVESLSNDNWHIINIFNEYKNGDWGSVSVMMFFMLSGGLLWKRYPNFSKENRFIYSTFPQKM